MNINGQQERKYLEHLESCKKYVKIVIETTMPLGDSRKQGPN